MIGDRLKKFRKDLGFSQERMADQMYLSQSQYSRLENRSDGFTINQLIRAAKILKIEVSQLLNASMTSTNNNQFENEWANFNLKDNLLKELEDIKAREKEILRLLFTQHSY